MSTLDQLMSELKDAHEHVVGSFNSINSRVDEIEAKLGREGLNGSTSTIIGGRPANRDIRDEIKAFYNIIGRPDLPITDASVESFKRYDDALMAYLVRGDGGLTSDMRNTLSVGSDPDGGYFVTPQRATKIIEKIWEFSPVRREASYMPMASGDSLEGVADVADLGGGWVGEHEARDETSGLSLAEYKISLHEQYCMPVTTQKLLDTAGPNVDQILTRKIARSFARREGTAFVVGNGVSKPRGFLDYESNTTDDDDRDWWKLQHVNTGVSGGFDFDSSYGDDGRILYDLIAKLKPDYRPNAKWFMNRQTAATIRKLRDGQGRFLWVDGLREGESDRLLGYPVVMLEDLPDVAANSKSIAFGDLRESYQIIDMPSIRILRDPYTTKGKVKYYSTMRVGAGLINSDSLKLLRFSAS